MKADPRLLDPGFTELSLVVVQDAAMQELFDLIRANPWPFIGGLIALVCAIIAEVFGSRDRSGGGDLPDPSWDD
jgi:hypothetical protein